MEVADDRIMEPALREEVIGLRGSIVAAARRTPLPDRFTERPHGERPAWIITDQETGREATVPLFAYAPARELLAALFGEAPAAVPE